MARKPPGQVPDKDHPQDAPPPRAADVEAAVAKALDALRPRLPSDTRAKRRPRAPRKP